MRRILFPALLVFVATAAAPRPTLSPNVRQYVSIDAPALVLAHVRVIGGNLVSKISDIRNIEMVFTPGVGYDPAKLIASVTGKVGLF